MARGIGGHQSPVAQTNDWITPKNILDALGPFDLDPCASVSQPWPTAAESYCLPQDGLALPWKGRVWLNPPYGGNTVRWIERLAEHGTGTALIFARTETKIFHPHVWSKADAVLFLRGRLHFHRPDGTRAHGNAGGPSVLVAYGAKDGARLRDSGIDGKFVWLTP